MLCPTVHRTNFGGMDILAQVLDRVRLGGTLLFHFELGHPWNLALPARPYALFHYLSRGSATLALELGQEIQMTEGDFVVITRGDRMCFIRIAGPSLCGLWISIDRRRVLASLVTAAVQSRSRP